MNLINYEVTGMTATYDAVHREADPLSGNRKRRNRWLVPQNALDRNAAYFSKLENFSKSKILEHQIR